MSNEKRIKVSPTIRAYSDDEHKKLDIEIELHGVNPTDCTECVRVFRQDHHPGKGERIMS